MRTCKEAVKSCDTSFCCLPVCLVSLRNLVRLHRHVCPSSDVCNEVVPCSVGSILRNEWALSPDQNRNLNWRMECLCSIGQSEASYFPGA